MKRGLLIVLLCLAVFAGTLAIGLGLTWSFRSLGAGTHTELLVGLVVLGLLFGVLGRLNLRHPQSQWRAALVLLATSILAGTAGAISTQVDDETWRSWLVMVLALAGVALGRWAGVNRRLVHEGRAR